MAIKVSAFGLATAFAASAISFLSPCVLPLVPGYVSYVAGQAASGKCGRLRTFSLSLCFVAGFTTVFVSLGAGASALGFVLWACREELNLAGGS
jgi:cytochrome c-type biogenesis protein